MEINNFNQISSLLEFNSSDEFLFLQILKRSKDTGNATPITVNTPSRVIKYYTIRSKEDLMKYKDEIIFLCNSFNARAYIDINKRSFKYVSYYMQLLLADLIYLEQDFAIKDLFSRAATQGDACIKPHKWIVNLDTKNDMTLLEYISIIREVTKDNDAVLNIIPTLQGYHIITKPFNKVLFKQTLVIKNQEDVIIHTNNPTLLYYKSC